MTTVVRAPEVEAFPPAKLNLFLEILGRRPDGYHDLESLMVAIDLRDRLVLEDDPAGAISLTCDDPGLPTDATNLVVRAAERLRSRADSSRGARISLFKSIPARAGLGGGSSDAATTLTELDRLWSTGLAPTELDDLAAELGSDCVFFRHGPAAICRGRGERIEPWTGASRFSFVLVLPPFGVSTAEVYRRLTPPENPRPIAPFLDALASGDTRRIGSALHNRLQPVAESICPDLVRVREALESLVPSHLDGTLMSGSGSAHFGLAPTPDAAIAAARRLEPLGLGQVRVVVSGP